jgi:hypothetical protein
MTTSVVIVIIIIITMPCTLHNGLKYISQHWISFWVIGHIQK